MMNNLNSGFQIPDFKTVFVIAGPTAVGKTAIAIELAKLLGTSIISADSRQCYKEMNIGTAKPSPEELAIVKHYFIDSFSITENITAADYERLSLQYLNEIFQTNDYAVVCGGTGLYIKALTDGLDDMPETNPEVEDEINQLYKREGLKWLQDVLQHEDPVFFSMAETENPARLIRALVFQRSTGKSITEYRSGIKKLRPFHIIKCALELPREQLYTRINQRVDSMIGDGLVEEVKSLLPYRHLKNLQTVGYAELFDYFDGLCSLSYAIDKIKQHTRNYAKRQLTWFRKDKEFIWFNASDSSVARQMAALKK